MRKTGLPARKAEQHFTYRDYRQWPDDERWELIAGVAYSMSSPSRAHQSVRMEIGRQLANFLRGNPCQVWAAPLDVFFPRVREQDEDDVDTVVQPDLVVEILSPSTSRKDLHEKYELYERSGVKEYWVVEPSGRWVQQYTLGPDGRFAPEVTWEGTGTLESVVLPGFTLAIQELWATTGPR